MKCKSDEIDKERKEIQVKGVYYAVVVKNWLLLF
jgi:hypothetical protein